MAGPNYAPVRFATTRDERSIAYAVLPGKNPPFLVINSPGSPPISLRSSTERLSMPFARDRAVVWFEFRGTGLSDPRPPASLDELVWDLEAVTNAIDGPLDAVSMGARGCFSACAFAAQHPALWRSLLLVEASLRPEENWFAFINRPGWQADYWAHLRIIARNTFAPMTTAELDAAVAEWMTAVPAASLEAYIATDCSIEHLLPQMDLPVLVTNWVRPAPDARIAQLLPLGILVHRDASTRMDIDNLRDTWDAHLGSSSTAPRQASRRPVRSRVANPRSSA